MPHRPSCARRCVAPPRGGNNAVNADGRESMYCPAAQRNRIWGWKFAAVTACVAAESGAADKFAAGGAGGGTAGDWFAVSSWREWHRRSAERSRRYRRAARGAPAGCARQRGSIHAAEARLAGGWRGGRPRTSTPGVTFLRNGQYSNSSGGASDIAVRGIDSIAGAATTALYIDDTPIQTRHIDLSQKTHIRRCSILIASRCCAAHRKRYLGQALKVAPCASSHQSRD